MFARTNRDRRFLLVELRQGIVVFMLLEKVRCPEHGILLITDEALLGRKSESLETDAIRGYSRVRSYHIVSFIEGDECRRDTITQFIDDGFAAAILNNAGLRERQQAELFTLK